MYSESSRPWFAIERPSAAYALTVAAVGVAFLVRLALDPLLGDELPFFTFYFALLVASWFCGLRAGVLALVLGMAIGVYAFCEPREGLMPVRIQDRFDLLRFAIVGFAFSATCELLRKHRRRSEERRELMFTTLSSIGDAVITTDLQARVTYLNGVAERLTGWTLADARGQPLADVFRIVNEYTRDIVESPAERALREGVIVGLANHTLLIRKDGVELPIDDSAAPIRDELGRVSGCVLIFRDVSETKQHEREVESSERTLRRVEGELRARHDELQRVYDTTPVGMCLLDRELRFVRINERLAQINGAPVHEHLGRPLREILPKLADELEPRFRAILETGEPLVEVEISGETAGLPGVVRTWLASYHPQRDASGVIMGINAVIHEITDRKRDEVRIYELLGELKEADKRKDEFLAMLAHELRGPLAPLRNTLELVKRAGGAPEVLRPACDTMDRQLGQLVRLVDDLLDVSRITRSRLELRKERVELASLVFQAVEMCRPLAETAGHELVVDLPPEPILVYGDPARLTQVFGNLLNNACKYTKPGGRIHLSALSEKGEAVISVRDNGVGLPAGQLEAIFGMFTQVEHGTEHAQGGLGIGLTLVRRLLELHGGSVHAHSDGPGRGSEFVVRLPQVTEGTPTVRVHVPSESAPPVPRRILVVDDNRDSAESLALLLELTGHETRRAHDGAEALEVAQAWQPDVVLLDIGLPKMSGHEVCRHLREQPWARGLLIVALTGWGQDVDRRRSAEAGFDAHMVKPVDPAELARLLAERVPEPVKP